MGWTGRVCLAPKTEERNQDSARSKGAASIESLAVDPDEPKLVIGSLRSFADFFIQEDRLSPTALGVGPEESLEAE